MEGRARYRLIGAALAFGLVGLPCLARAQSDAQTTTTTTTSGNQTTTTVQTTVSADMAAPIIPEANRVRALEAINAAGLTGGDIAKVMGLMEDLRDAEAGARARSVQIQAQLLTANSGTLNPPADQQLSQAQQDYLNKVQSIWNTVADRIGQDKANALHRLVEPTVDTRPYAQTDEHMIAIQQLLNQFDQQIAAGPGGTTTAQTTTTTETTTAQGTTGSTTVTQTNVNTQPGMAHRTGTTGVFVSSLPVGGSYTIVSEPLVSPNELVDVLQEKYLAMNTTPETEYLLLQSRRDVSSPDLKYAWEKMLRVWD